MVYRIFVEKRPGLANEAAGFLSDVKTLLGIDGLKDVRVINRYDVQNIEETLFEESISKVFSEPQVDRTAKELTDLVGKDGWSYVFAVEALPGQFDQRADSAEQCIQIISQEDRPLIRFARVYVLYGDLQEEDIAAIKDHIINPVETREAALEKPETLEMEYEIPEKVAILTGFIDMDKNARNLCIEKYGLAMDEADLEFCQTDRKSVV